MKVRVIKKNGKYIKRHSLEVEDWMTLLVVVSVLGFTVIQIILWR